MSDIYIVRKREISPKCSLGGEIHHESWIQVIFPAVSTNEGLLMVNKRSSSAPVKKKHLFGPARYFPP